MKKFIQILTTAVISTAFIGSFASAATCDGAITITGPNSNNVIACNNVDNINLTCNNNIWAGTANYQDATSGNGNASGNTSSGIVATGTAVNNNGSNVVIGTSCGALASSENSGGAGAGGGGAAAPAAPAAPVAPETPGGGIGELPNTANSPAILTMLRLVAITIGVALAVRLAAYAASRYLIRKPIEK